MDFGDTTNTFTLTTPTKEETTTNNILCYSSWLQPTPNSTHTTTPPEKGLTCTGTLTSRACILVRDITLRMLLMTMFIIIVITVIMLPPWGSHTCAAWAMALLFRGADTWVVMMVLLHLETDTCTAAMAVPVTFQRVTIRERGVVMEELAVAGA